MNIKNLRLLIIPLFLVSFGYVNSMLKTSQSRRPITTAKADTKEQAKDKFFAMTQNMIHNQNKSMDDVLDFLKKMLPKFRPPSSQYAAISELIGDYAKMYVEDMIQAHKTNDDIAAWLSDLRNSLKEYTDSPYAPVNKALTELLSEYSPQETPVQPLTTTTTTTTTTTAQTPQQGGSQPTDFLLQAQVDNPEQKVVSFTADEIGNIAVLREMIVDLGYQAGSTIPLERISLEVLQALKMLEITTPQTEAAIQQKLKGLPLKTLISLLNVEHFLNVTCAVLRHHGMGKFQQHSLSLNSQLNPAFMAQLNSLDAIKTALHSELPQSVIDFINEKQKEIYWDGVATSQQGGKWLASLPKAYLWKGGPELMLMSNSDNYVLAFDETDNMFYIDDLQTKRERSIPLPKRLTPHMMLAFPPKISHDGTYIAYIDHYPHPKIMNYYLYITNTITQQTTSIPFTGFPDTSSFDSHNNFFMWLSYTNKISLYKPETTEIKLIDTTQVLKKTETTKIFLISHHNNDILYYGMVHPQVRSNFISYEHPSIPAFAKKYDYRVYAGPINSYTIPRLWEAENNSSIQKWILSSPIFDALVKHKESSQGAANATIKKILSDRDSFRIFSCVNVAYPKSILWGDRSENSIYIIDLIPDITKLPSPSLIGFYLLALNTINWNRERLDKVNALFFEQSPITIPQKSISESPSGPSGLRAWLWKKQQQETQEDQPETTSQTPQQPSSNLPIWQLPRTRAFLWGTKK